MVRRAIGNLLSNALRYAETGSVVLVCLSDADHVAKLDVINQGATIDPVHLPRLFDRFYRADPARAHPGSDGAGLGLAITKAIVESHGGTIAVRSSHGRTCFTMVFPDKQRR
jgi:two-component system heavy metal sensor histidine kinase CusS